MKLPNALPALFLVLCGFSALAWALDAILETKTRPTVVKEIFFTAPFPEENLDSPAVWSGPQGTRWLIVTAKESHRLHIYDADNGRLLRKFGAHGNGDGQFRRPNGIWAARHVLYVVERDNRRIQVLSLPGLKTLGYLGNGRLIKPYGIYVREITATSHHVYVTDNYDILDQPATQAGRPAGRAGYGHRACFFKVDIAADALKTSAHPGIPAHFGDSQGEGRLDTVESLYGDPEFDRLMIADEADDAHHIKVYSLAGRYTGRILGDGLFQYEPEGISLYITGEKSGYWIFTDQAPGLSTYHVFDREDLAYLGSFQGTGTRNTDGIWIDPLPAPCCPAGCLYTLEDDQAVSAFSMEAVLLEMGLDP